MELKKCIISRYDKSITKPPYLTIKVDEVEVMKPEKIHDNLGEQFAANLIRACYNKGYILKFYTSTDEKGFDYEIVVH